ncbi:MAG: cell wall-binding repeat-containing protein [Finegoldia sp.]|uniref:cell wall-binding repeat-containing protein n=1 Tax=Finegoldia sp. TaxID=1981334 RepID=UPI003992A923
MKNKKLLKTVVMLSLATTLAVPFNTLADSQGKRIGGRDRFEVAINVANKFSDSKSCIVLNYLAYSDSISSSEIAKGDMPIYYTKSDSIDSNTLKDIRNKGYKNVFIIGGEKSVSKNVENELAKTSKITRVSGRNRYDVNYKTLDKNKENLIVVSGENFADGLVSSALTQIKNATIAITPSNEVHERLKQYLNVNKNLKNIYIVGGEKSISKNVENKLSKYANVQRISGANRYETSEKLAKEISDSKYIVVSGENFADNLVAGSLARKDKRAVVLSKRADFSPMIKEISKDKDFIVVGGNLSIDESIFDKNLDTDKTENKKVTVKETIKYATKEEKDPTLKQGERKTKQRGANGEKEIIYEETYKDGVFISKKKIGENITKKPVDEIILVGTKADKEPTVTTKRVTVKETIKYATKEEKDPTLKQGERKTKQQGTNGEKEIIYEETYKDGVLVSKKKISENITKKPVDEIILVGTKVEDKDIIEPIPTTDEELIKYYNVDYNEPLSQKEQEIMDELNRVRKENGLNELKLSKTLTRTARIHARDASLKGEITHAWTPKLLELSEDIKFKKRQLGAETTWAVNWDDDAKYIIQGFMDSPRHREILMRNSLVYVGVARYDSKFDRDNNGKVDPMSMIFIRVYGEDEFNELDYIPD